jgi:hypothetical protein
MSGPDEITDLVFRPRPSEDVVLSIPSMPSRRSGG